jgi:prepilin-type N-terminal cleavage/methylation domain-containing protein
MTERTTTPIPNTLSPARAFTLVELMVSIALVLILILGVNQVFKLTSDTIGASNGLSDSIRLNRAVQASMFDDLRKSVLPGTGLSRGAPFFTIRSERTSAFPSAVEEQNDRDYTRALTGQQAVDDAIRSVDANGDNTESLAESSELIALGSRSHRVDQLSFFARDVYRRQTGNDSTYSADMTASEAWVWYGHIKQPEAGRDPSLVNYMGGSKNPGWTTTSGSGVETPLTSPNNFYARQWFLGRVANLLIPPEADGRIYRYDSHGIRQEAQQYIGIKANELGPTQKPFQPLGQGSFTTTDNTTWGQPESQWARYDLLGTSMEGYENFMRGVVLSAPAGSPAESWWQGSTGLTYRFSGFPYPTKPMTSHGAARTVPCFVPACTQFAVEFAGDFITQVRGDLNGDGVEDADDRRDSRYGQAVIAKGDNVLDFIVDRSNTSQPTERVRWYGFPRNVDTFDDTATGVVVRGTPVGSDINTMRDVVPVRDVMAACPPAPPTERVFIPERFERDVPTIKPNYGVADGVALGARYVCAWGPTGSYLAPTPPPTGPNAVVPDPPLPKMVRLVVGVDDPDGRISDTQYYEYVIDLP